MLQSVALGSPPDDPVWGLVPCFLRPDCSFPGRLFIVFSPLPRMLQSVALGSAPDDPVRGLVPCSTPPRIFQSRASMSCFLSVSSDAPVRGTGFTPGRSSPGARAVLHSAPVAPIRGVILLYSLRCLGCSSPWHLVHPRTIQSGGLSRASFRPGCSIPGRPFNVFSPLPRGLQSVAPGSPPEDPVRGLGPRSTPPRMLQSGASFCRILSVASDAAVRGTGLTPGRSSPGASAVLHSAPVAPIRGVFLSYSLRCLRCSSPWHRVLPRRIQSGSLGRAPLRPECFNPRRLFVVFSPLPRVLQSVALGSPPNDPVWGLGPSSTPPRMLQSGASCFFLILLSSAFACAVLRCVFFFARPSSLLLPHSPRSAVLEGQCECSVCALVLSGCLTCQGVSWAVLCQGAV